MTRRASFLAILATLGCSYDGKFRAAVSGLDRTLVFTEQVSGGSFRPLSRSSADNSRDVPPGATRVPDPAEVDINSTIQIDLVKNHLVPDGPAADVPEEGDGYRVARTHLIALLRAIADYIAAREAALQAQAKLHATPRKERAGSAIQKIFDQASDAYSESRSNVAKRLEPIWPEDTPAGKAVDMVWTQDPTMARLHTFVQEKIDALDRDYRLLVDKVRLKAKAIRLEAFLETKEGSPTPIHLPYYDSLKEMQIQRHDRLGLAMSSRQREFFDRAAGASRELANAANEVLRREKSVREAFSKVSIESVRKLSEAVALVEDLRAELKDGPSIKVRFQAMVTELDNFVTQLARDLGQDFVDRAQAAVREALKSGRETLEKEAPFAAVLALAERVRKLREGLAAWTPETIMETLRVAKEVAEGLKEPLELLGKARTALSAMAASLESRVQAAANDLLPKVKEAWKNSAASKKVEEVVSIAGRVIDVIESVTEVLGLREYPPVLSRTRVPETIDVPADLAKNTSLNLQRTTRIPGDIISVRATLLQEGQEPETAVASFTVREFGWHARLQPGVVLVRPHELAAGNEEFAFAPVVSWLHTYTPLPEDTNVFRGIARFLRPSCGIHAAFLDFSAQKEVEIGLGATLAFGNDWFVLGGGYNLFREDARDGDYYYFVGTSLIPILQAIGLGSAGGAGEKP
jgi:hypothetical protein